MVRVKFDVSGVTYSIERDFLNAGPPSKLTQLCASVEPMNKANVYIINRPPELFSAILSLYLIGERHMPMTSCPGTFLKEMEFWEIDPKCMSNCCYYKLKRYQEEQRALANFHRHIVTTEVDILRRHLPKALTTIRTRIWSVVDYRNSNLLNRVYYALTFTMILLSIATISLGTCDTFRRNMTICERLEYMETTAMEHRDIFAGLISKPADCRNTTLSYLIDSPNVMKQSGYSVYGDDYDYWLSLGVQDYEFIEVKVVEASVTTTNADRISIKIPNMKVPVRILNVLDMLTLVFFTFDFLSRLVSCPSVSAYFRSVINIADAMALIGTYVHLIILCIRAEETYLHNWVDGLALMQILRSLRLFRVVRDMTPAKVLAYTIWQNTKDLAIILLFILVGICTFGSVLYILENNRFIENIPTAWYWALITMTTVGYGDIVPTTIGGKVLACLRAMFGLLLFALTIPIFVSRFFTLYRYANLKCFSRLNCEDDSSFKEHVIGAVEMRHHVNPQQAADRSIESAP